MALKDGLGGGTGIANINHEINVDTVLTSNTKLYFRDAGLYLQSDSDGSLKISSDGTGDAVTIDSDGRIVIDAAASSGNAINLKLSGNKDGSASVTVEDSDTFPVHKLESQGDQRIKGKVKRI